MLASNLRLSPFRVALLATLAAAIVYLPASQLGIVQQLEGELLDLRFHARPPQPTSGEIVLVLIDDASLAEVGRWPWSRSLMADLVARLEAAGAGTVALDLLLAEPESSGVPTAALAPLLQDDDALARLPELIEQAEGDRSARRRGGARRQRRAADPVRAGPGRGGPGRGGPGRGPPAFVADAAFRVVQQPSALSDLAEPPAGGRVLAPIAELGRAAAGLGHVNAPLDRSGAQRLEYPVIRHGADYYPSFSLEIARQHLRVGRDRTRLLLGQGIVLEDRLVPTDESMRLPINYDRPGRFPAVSAAAVLDGEAGPALFAGKIVLIGGTAAGIGNTFVTPFSSLMPGVERHATVVDSILRGDFLVRREAGVLVDLVTVIVAGDPDRLGRPAPRHAGRFRHVPSGRSGLRRGQHPGVHAPRPVAQPVPAARGADLHLSRRAGLQLLRRQAAGARHPGRVRALSEPGPGRPRVSRSGAAAARRRAARADGAVRRHPQFDSDSPSACRRSASRRC